ncbi:MAG: FAD-binding protein, partial [Rhodospirillaceae bacterium]|nr:FAD-binding protein [Rhodospirillaceae bacterium]
AHPMAQGVGLTMGLAAGGYLRGGDKYLCTFGSVLQHRAFPAPLEVAVMLYPNMRQPWEIFVNARGARFVREDHPSVDHREKALLAQPGHRHFIVFDQEILDKAPPIAPTWPRQKLDAAFNAHPMFVKADTLGELAARAGLDAPVLAKSVADYNAAQAAGSDRLGRNHMPLPIARPPFYAIAVQGFTVKSCAGLGIDTRMRVLKPGGAPIPNLYAVGEVIGGGNTSGDSFVNGMMVTPALTFGRMLGQSILNFES